MATYESYKKVTNEQIIDGTVTEDKLGTDVRHRLCTKWLIGDACRCSAGCCCLWTVPACTRRVYFELWGAGGNGNGTTRSHSKRNTPRNQSRGRGSMVA